ncbi:hypothetical protein F3C99_13310 [Vitellibacter sp. q18]|jgi:hypothetical protein|nr:hypothetical protein [Aequorivita lutea]
MKKLLLLFLAILLLNSCKNNSDAEKQKSEVASEKFEKIAQLHWLLGTWTEQNGESFSQETWSQETPSAFTAYSFTQVGKETVFAETMALEERADSLFLTVATANQNKEAPVTFTLVSSENGHFIFENKNHDFPQRIVYTNPAKDSLHAWIEGKENGEAKKIDFSFSRKN